MTYSNGWLGWMDPVDVSPFVMKETLSKPSREMSLRWHCCLFCDASWTALVEVVLLFNSERNDCLFCSKGKETKGT